MGCVSAGLILRCVALVRPIDRRLMIAQTLSATISPEMIEPGAGAFPAAAASAGAAGWPPASSNKLKFDPASPESPLNDFELVNLDAVRAMGDGLLDGERVNSKESGSLCDARDESNASGAKPRGEGEGRASSENRVVSTVTRRLPNDPMRPRSADDPYTFIDEVCRLAKPPIVLFSLDKFGRYESMRNSDCRMRHMSAGAKQRVVPM